jgi:hypothetical protein
VFEDGATEAGCPGEEGASMDDQNVMDRINELAHEEHQLFDKASTQGLDAKEHERLNWLQVNLDQCWDLLHQRRARRSAGLDPEGAKVRDEATVEGYVD